MYIRFKSSQQMIAAGGTYTGGEDIALNLTTSADYMNSFVQDYEDKIARDKAKKKISDEVLEVQEVIDEVDEE